MKLLRSFLILGLTSSLSFTAWAESRDFGLALLPEPSKKTFSEFEQDLPPLPNPKTGEWLPIYVNAVHKGKPHILLDSLQILPDRSIRYIFNARSASGYDNITAEGIVCAEGVFNSDGMLHKTFAYADLSQQIWRPTKQTKWQALGGKQNARDPVRRVLYEVMCANNKILNEKQLREVLIKQAS